ncbi:hypothetical protein G7A66_03405 [Altererythrobacter sp. SALINAS58]|uniref:DUF5681 domain-containing protein n=1 Tax=Alteripontixanthobacter muriae TaxID=2705546 RepID=UPI0015771611|nr:DUF5681 domain-containing protein [Alteripontixanthobacter muriae]NTZ42154.1 hypothetical protein [Alteripontixanthobacter muriae]
MVEDTEEEHFGREASSEGPDHVDASGSADSEYKVGKNKPPLHSRFKKGNRAGKGRRKGSQNLGTIVNQAASLKSSVLIGGKSKKMSKVALAVHQIANKASAGDLKAASTFLSLVERHEPREDPPDLTAEQMSADIVALRAYLDFYDFLNSGEEDGNAAR